MKANNKYMKSYPTYLDKNHLYGFNHIFHLENWLKTNANLKLASIIFHQICISHLTIAFQKLIKIFLFHLKSTFCSPDIQTFVLAPSPLFPLSAIALEVDQI